MSHFVAVVHSRNPFHTHFSRVDFSGRRPWPILVCPVVGRRRSFSSSPRPLAWVSIENLFVGCLSLFLDWELTRGRVEPDTSRHSGCSAGPQPANQLVNQLTANMHQGPHHYHQSLLTSNHHLHRTTGFLKAAADSFLGWDPTSRTVP